MRVFSLCAAVLLASAPLAAAKPLANNGQMSWGKPGVSLDDYRTDALRCTTAGTIAELPEQANESMGIAGTFVNGEFEAPDVHEVIMQQRLLNYQAGMDAREARQRVVDQCLRDLGYEPFLLTNEQRARLRTFQHGTDDRRQYLHSLGSDPAVLNAQRIAD